jgi:hypothetical protein
MADTALFSSFHRPRTPFGEPIQDAPREASLLISESDPAPADLPVSAEAGDPVVELASDPGSSRTQAPLPCERDEVEYERQEPGSPTAGWVDLTAIPISCDQLGLANPIVISVVAHLPGFEPVQLDAATSGIYRPPGFRPAPWSGFAYDQTRGDVLTGVAAGTRILTARGEVEVERLMPGDAALALRSPALLPISWIGRSVATARPIRIEPGALGPNVPRRLLCLGPDQPIFIEPVPVAARTLVNGTTIREVETDSSDLFHVDVGQAEILFAEGLPLSSSIRASLPNG